MYKELIFMYTYIMTKVSIDKEVREEMKAYEDENLFSKVSIPIFLKSEKYTYNKLLHNLHKPI